MPQNIYDDPGFFDGYSRLPRSLHGLHGAPEWEAVRAMLPELRGAHILDLGCGFGAFDRWAAEQGAQQVIGIDLSERMLRRARELAQHPAVEFRIGDMARLDIAERDFDLVYSALAFHYVEDFPGLCRTIRSKLRDAGRLVATVEHPIFSAPRHDEWLERDGRPVWPLDSYLEEGLRTRNWFADGVIKYHRTIGTYVNALVDNGFRLTRLIEWGPDARQIDEHPEWARERDRPPFLLFAAEAIS
ncbi:MAG: class I SAM-dependent methyltransferase [Burkholderiaceae bacterium]|jgi:SAM-dependent methyltransferase|nr:class I SAM-dependent methyltransferase [Burkholderiaceae bacterium]MEB2319733.1 class I SAM-dependent methyltransferase [Pseudomonadota bacterium]